MTGLAFRFDQYLNNGDVGQLEYRVDRGTTVSTRLWQKDNTTYIFNSPGEPTDDSPHLKTILAGNRVAVRATSYDGDTDQAQYDIANLLSVVSQYGCSF